MMSLRGPREGDLGHSPATPLQEGGLVSEWVSAWASEQQSDMQASSQAAFKLHSHSHCVDVDALTMWPTDSSGKRQTEKLRCLFFFCCCVRLGTCSSNYTLILHFFQWNCQHESSEQDVDNVFASQWGNSPEVHQRRWHVAKQCDRQTACGSFLQWFLHRFLTRLDTFR